MTEEQAYEMLYDIGEAMIRLNPKYERLVRSSDGSRMVSRMLVECTLPLDVETAVGLQILGDQAVADPDLELTILASLGEE